MWSLLCETGRKYPVQSLDKKNINQQQHTLAERVIQIVNWRTHTHVALLLILYPCTHTALSSNTLYLRMYVYYTMRNNNSVRQI